MAWLKIKYAARYAACLPCYWAAIYFPLRWGTSRYGEIVFLWFLSKAGFVAYTPWPIYRDAELGINGWERDL